MERYDFDTLKPLGIVRHFEITIATLRFGIAAVVLRMEDIQEAYPLLLGRPWLQQAKAKHDWETDVLTIRQGNRRIKMVVQARTTVAPANRPTHAKGIYLADGLDDDEEERYLEANQTVVGLFEIDVEALLQKHEKPSLEANPSKAAVVESAEDKGEEKPVRQSRLNALS